VRPGILRQCNQNANRKAGPLRRSTPGNTSNGITRWLQAGRPLQSRDAWKIVKSGTCAINGCQSTVHRLFRNRLSLCAAWLAALAARLWGEAIGNAARLFVGLWTNRRTAIRAANLNRCPARDLLGEIHYDSPISCAVSHRVPKPSIGQLPELLA